jgi:SAM-dependent methyltransferase
MQNLDQIYSSPDSSDYGAYSSEKRFCNIFGPLVTKNLTVLDYGCGPGNLCTWFETNNKIPKEYYGYDIRKETIAIAKQNHPNWIFSNHLPLNDTQFDVVLLIGTISYAFDSDIALCKSVYRQEVEKAKSYLRFGGELYITARKVGKERGVNNEKLMITYAYEELTSFFGVNQVVDLFPHEWLVRYVK